MKTQICEFCSGVYTIEKEFFEAEKVYCPLCAHMNEVQRNRSHNSQSVHKATIAIVLEEEKGDSMADEIKKEISPPEANKVSFTKPINKEILLDELKKTFPHANFAISENGYALSTWGRKIVEVSGSLPTEEQILEVIKLHKPKFTDIKEEAVNTDLEPGKRKVTEGLNEMVATLFANQITELKDAETKNSEILEEVKAMRKAISDAMDADSKKREAEKKAIDSTLAKHYDDCKKLIAASFKPIEDRITVIETNMRNAGNAWAKIGIVAEKKQ